MCSNHEMKMYSICTVQVFTNMQPLNVCLSYSGTMKIIGNISEDHDIDVQMWSDELVPKPQEKVSIAGVYWQCSIVTFSFFNVMEGVSM